MSARDAAAENPAGRYPIARTRLIGRERERARAHALLRDEAAPVLTLTGPGGSGKTRLAQSLAGDFEAYTEGGVVWVDLAPLSDPALAVLTVAQALGLPPLPSLPIETQVLSALRADNPLLILDNCEHVLEPVADLVASWLAACPELQVVATSRSPLRLRSERELPIEPLAIPQSDAATDTLLHNDAVRLFAERAEAVDPHFRLDASNVREVAAICRALDGLPLAIELAAARTRVLSLGVLQHQMSDRLHLLRDGARDLPVRQRTMAGAIAWSYALLTPSQQSCFRRLGVFAGGWSLPAAIAVAAEDAGAEGHILDDLTALVDQSLVRRDYDSPDLRFTMLETIREFALRELATQGEEAAVRQRHAAWYRDHVESLDLHHARQGDHARTRSLAPEQDNLRLALAWFASQGDAWSLNQLSAALAKFWFDLGQFSEARHWLHLAIANDDDVDVLTRARAWNKAGWLAMCQGDLEQAAALRETGVALARESGEPFLLAEAVFEAGILAFWQEDLGQATALIEEAQRTLAGIEAEYATAPVKMCSTVNLLGGIALIAGDLPLATQRGEAAVEMARALGASADLGYALCGLGYVRLQQDLPHDATACFLEALAITWAQHDLAFLARLHWTFAAVALHQQQPELAAQLIGAADALDARTGSAMWPNDRVVAASCLERLAAALPAATFAELRARGSALPVEQPVALAMHLAAGVLGQQPAAATWARGHGPDLAALGTVQVAGRARALRSPQGRRPAIGPGRLTEREHAVLLHLIDGCTDREIAARLFISRRTVSKHLEAIFTKLGVHSRGAAVAEAQRLGVSEPSFPDNAESPISAD